MLALSLKESEFRLGWTVEMLHLVWVGVLQKTRGQSLYII